MILTKKPIQTNLVSFFSLLFLLFLLTTGRASADDITLTTYYPLPLGLYDQIRLVQRAASPPCSAATAGTLYVNSTGLQFCRANGTWVSGYGKVWTQSGYNIYPTDTPNPSIKVGIGLTSPQFRFHIQDGGILATGGTETLAVAGAGTRLIWYPAKSAFRAGRITGSQWNDAQIGDYSFVLGGENNQANGSWAGIVGGRDSTASGNDSFLGGGQTNTASGTHAGIVGGTANTANANHSFLAGGQSNQTTGTESGIVAGIGNTASATRTFVAGGQTNRASGAWAAVIGGTTNTASADKAFVAGGQNNQASGAWASTVGGRNNTALGLRSFMAGGESNRITGVHSGIIGGSNHTVTGDETLVAGGQNHSTNPGQTSNGLVGGTDNLVSANNAFVGGGQSHRAEADFTGLIGGISNRTAGLKAFIGGGENNTSGGSWAATIGGADNQADGDYSLASGRNMQLTSAADRTFVWGNSSGGLSVPTPDAFLVYSSNVSMGVGLTNPTARLHVAGNIKAVLPDLDNTLSTVRAMQYRSSTQEIGYDVAELFETSEEVEPGDVLVIDDTQTIKLRKSREPYDPKVAGVVSQAPAIVFEGPQLQIAPPPGGFTKGTKPPVALAGRILCKVTTENGEIQAGDFLTSSSVAGHAMKAEEEEKSRGAIVGMALESFKGGPNNEGKGRITILVTLQ